MKVKIVNNREVDFTNIRVGGFFALNFDGEVVIYRRLPDIVVGGGLHKNAMRMDEGTFYNIGATAQVCPVDTELVVTF